MILALISGIFLVRAYQTSPEPQPFSPTDSSALRIVSMAPNLTEILFEMGLEDSLVGISSDSDYPAGVESIPKVGTFWQPDMEAVIARRPTLVITLGFSQQAKMADKLRSLGIETLTVDIESIDDLFNAIQVIGEASDRRQTAEQLVDKLKGQFETLRSECVGHDPISVLWVIQRSPLRVAGQQTYVTECLEIIGAANAIGPTLHQYPPIDAEQVLAANPDVIVEPVNSMDNPHKQFDEALQFYNRFSRIEAVKNNRIYLVNADLVSRIGPRLPKGLHQLALGIRTHDSSQEALP